VTSWWERPRRRLRMPSATKRRKQPSTSLRALDFDAVGPEIAHHPRPSQDPMLSNATRNLVMTGLAELLTVEDAERYLTMPILEPTREIFPDAWSADQDGVHRLLRRIMFYAGLGEMPVAIERYVFNEDDDDCHVIAFFRGIENGVCRF